MKAEFEKVISRKNKIGQMVKEKVLIGWADEKIGFGKMIFEYKGEGIYEVDTEYMDFDHIVKVIKALK